MASLLTIDKGENRPDIAALEKELHFVRNQTEKLLIREPSQVAAFEHQKLEVELVKSAIKITAERNHNRAEADRKEREWSETLRLMTENLDREKEERQNNVKANRQLKVTVRKFVCRALIERWGRVLAGAVGDLMPTPKKKTPQERKAYWKDKAPSSVFFELFRSIIDGSHQEAKTFRPP